MKCFYLLQKKNCSFISTVQPCNLQSLYNITHYYVWSQHYSFIMTNQNQMTEMNENILVNPFLRNGISHKLLNLYNNNCNENYCRVVVKHQEDPSFSGWL